MTHHITIKLDHPPFEVTRESIMGLPEWVPGAVRFDNTCAFIHGLGAVHCGEHLFAYRGKVEVWSAKDVAKYIGPDPSIDRAIRNKAKETQDEVA